MLEPVGIVGSVLLLRNPFILLDQFIKFTSKQIDSKF